MKYFGVFICWFLCNISSAQKSFLYRSTNELISVESSVYYYVDYTNEKTFNQVQNLSFTPLEKKIINFGNVDESYWFKIDVENLTDEAIYCHLKNWELEIIDFYVIDKAGKVDSSKAGLFRKFSGHFFETSSTTFNLGKEPKSIFFRIKNPTIYLPIFFGTIQPLVKEMHFDNLLNGLLIGVMLAIAIYNFILFAYFREKLYFFCSSYIFSTIFAICRSQGFIHQFIFQDNVFFNAHPNLGIILSVIFGFFFVTGLLNSKQIAPVLHRILLIICLSLSGLVLLHFFIPKATIQNLIHFFLIINAIVFLITANFIWYKGYKPAKFFVLGWSIYLIGLILLIVSLAGVWTEYYLPIFIFWRFSFAVEFFFIAFATAYRFNQIKLEALDAQILVAQRSQEHEELLIKNNHLLAEKLQIEQSIKTYHGDKSISQLLQEIQAGNQPTKKISIPTIEGVIMFPEQDINRLEAMGSYCMIHFSENKKITTSKPMSHFEQMIDSEKFMRIHKSHIVNLNNVVRYIRGEGGSVVMHDKSEVPVSRRLKTELLQRLTIEQSAV